MAEEKTPPEQSESAPERPEWLPDQFKSGEDLVKSYEESRAEMSRAQTELARQQKEFTEALSRLEQAQQPQQPFNPQADPLIQAYQRANEEGDAATMLAIQAQISQAATAQILDQRLGEFSEKLSGATNHDRELALRMAETQVKPLYGDRWDTDIAPKLNERLANLPAQPSVEGYAEFLKEQALIIDYPRLKAQTDALEAERAAKLEAQTLAGGSARVPLQADENKEQWAAIKGANAGSWTGIVGS